MIELIHIDADSGWHIVRPIHTAALKRCHIDRSMDIATEERWHIVWPIRTATDLHRRIGRFIHICLSEGILSSVTV